MSMLEDNNGQGIAGEKVTSSSSPSPDVNKLNLSENDWQNVLKNLSSSSMSSLQVTLKKVLSNSDSNALFNQRGSNNDQPVVATNQHLRPHFHNNNNNQPIVHLPVQINSTTTTTNNHNNPTTINTISNNKTGNNNNGTILVAFTAQNAPAAATTCPGKMVMGSLGGHLTTQPNGATISAPITTSTIGQQGFNYHHYPQQQHHHHQGLTLNQVLAANQIAALLQQQQQQQQFAKVLQPCTPKSPVVPIIQNVITSSSSSPTTNIATSESTNNNSLYALATAAVEVASLSKVDATAITSKSSISPGTTTVAIIKDDDDDDDDDVVVGDVDGLKRKCLVEQRSDNKPVARKRTLVKSESIAVSQTKTSTKVQIKLEAEELESEEELEEEDTPENLENLEPKSGGNLVVQGKTLSAGGLTMSQSDEEDDDSDVSSNGEKTTTRPDDLDSKASNRSNLMVLRSNIQSKNCEDGTFDNDAIRRAKRRERNRVAAARCRQRRQDQIGELQSQVTQLYQTGESLRTQIKLMEFERNRLEKQIKLHNETKCPKTLILNPLSPYRETDLPPLTKILRLETNHIVPGEHQQQQQQQVIVNSNNKLPVNNTNNTKKIRPKESSEQQQQTTSKPSHLMNRPCSLQITPAVTTTTATKKKDEVETIMTMNGTSTTTIPAMMSLQQINLQQQQHQATTPSLTPSTLRLLGQLAGTPTINHALSPFTTATAAGLATGTPATTPNHHANLACLRLNSALGILSNPSTSTTPTIGSNTSVGSGHGIDLASLALTSPIVAQTTTNLSQIFHPQSRSVAPITSSDGNNNSGLLAISSTIENGLQIFRMISSNPSTTTPTNNTAHQPTAATTNLG